MKTNPAITAINIVSVELATFRPPLDLPAYCRLCLQAEEKHNNPRHLYPHKPIRPKLSVE